MAIVSAQNDVGWSVPSNANTGGQLVQKQPNSVPAALVVDYSFTNESQIRVNMTAMTLDSDTGGSPIISYSVEWNKGSGANFSPY